jgi:hypothetical protein
LVQSLSGRSDPAVSLEREARYTRGGWCPTDRALPASRDQKEAMGKVPAAILEPYREDVVRCLEKQGGLDNCHLIF